MAGRKRKMGKGGEECAGTHNYDIRQFQFYTIIKIIFFSIASDGSVWHSQVGVKKVAATSAIIFEQSGPGVW